jgi:spermidine/putrescine transport system substrate-binding protein
MNKIIGKINVLILSALMIVSGTAAVTGVFNTNRLTAVAADDHTPCVQLGRIY